MTRLGTQHAPRRWRLWWLALLLVMFCSGCVRSCAASRICDEVCNEEGLCDLRFSRAGDAAYRCYAGSDRGCAASRVCADEDRCFATEQGTCVVAAAVDAHACAGSRACSLRGHCGHRAGTCWADDDARCEASFECRTLGRCTARAGVCIPTTDAQCEASIGCEVEGLCSLRTYLGAGTCGVDLEDPSECAASWVCARYGRCAPARPADCEGCRYGYCAPPGEPGRLACTTGAHNLPSCSRDGRCAPDETYACAHAPDGRPGLSPDKPVARDASDPLVAQAAEDAEPAPPTTVPAPREVAPLPIPTPEPTPPVPPPGLGAVAYEFGDIQGHAYAGVLMHATLLTGVTGMEPDRAVDLLTLRTMPAQDCYPRAQGGFHPLDAIWLLEPFPQTEGTFAFDGGPMPGALSAKTWLWDGTTGWSENLALHGTITVDSRTAAQVRGHVEFRVTAYFQDQTIGTIRGPFVADLMDCATWRRWPL